MDAPVKTIAALEAELEELRHQLFEAHETIEAIRTGKVDALVVEGEKGHELYTLKSADLAYRVFIEKMTEGAVTLNTDGLILYCNSQFASLVQQPISQVIGHTLESFVAPEHQAPFQTTFQKCWTEECKIELNLLPDAGALPVQLSLATLDLENTSALSILVTNLSAQKKTQQLLEQNNRQLAEINLALEASNHDLQQFASVASHDLQEPLRKIQLFSNLLKEKADFNPSPEAKKYLEKIIGSAGRMHRLIIDVLNYSKLSANNNICENTNLNDLLNELLEDFELVIEEKEATITATNLPCIEVNYGQMRQVFQNIISNALKFSQPGVPPVIRFSATRLREKSFDSAADEDGPYCCISIADNGIGFDEKYISNIFSLFGRLHSKDRYEGTGIGLAIAKKIIEKHQGLLSAKSHLGSGSEFLLLLPVKQNS